MMPSSSLRLLEALAFCGPAGAHREQLMQQADMSLATFYRALEPLIKDGLARERSLSHYSLANHPHNFSFKLWNDQSRLLELPSPLRDEIQLLSQRIKQGLSGNLRALWFHGSASRNAQEPESDLDFLAVVAKDTDFKPQATRPVQLITFTEKKFQTAYQRGDAFLRTVITHGLLLLDHNFAQEFFLQPMPEPSLAAWKDRGEIQEQLEARLRFFLRLQELTEARQTLSQLAVAITRTMLGALDQYPPGKAELGHIAELYLGPAFAQLIRRCFEKQSDLENLLSLEDQLRFWQQSFALHVGHIKKLASSLTGPSRPFETACQEMLGHILPPGWLLSQALGPDLTMTRHDGSTIRLHLKTQKAPLSPPKARPSAMNTILVLNPLRELPLQQRPPFSEPQRQDYQKLGWFLIDSRQLLQASLRSLLEPNPPTLEDLLPSVLATVRPESPRPWGLPSTEAIEPPRPKEFGSLAPSSESS